MASIERLDVDNVWGGKLYRSERGDIPLFLTHLPALLLFLIRVLFKDGGELQVVGAFLVLVLASFPWEFVYYGRLVANLLAFCFVPAMLVCTLEVFGFGIAKRVRMGYGLILLMSFALSLFRSRAFASLGFSFQFPT